MGALVEDAAPLFEDCLFERLRTNFDLSGSGGAVYATGGIKSPWFIWYAAESVRSFR